MHIPRVDPRRSSSETKGTAMSRRTVLKAAFSATAFSIVKPAEARGTEANSRITAGAVGLGGRGAWIAEHVAKHPGFQVTAVADYFPDVARSVGERLGVPEERRFSGLSAYRRLLESKVEAVFLETPPYFFPIHAKAAVDAGCHVYVAKPVAVDVPGCLSILEAGRQAARTKRVFLVDFQTRTDPFHVEAVRRVHDGMIGKIGLITAFYHDECFLDLPKEKTAENLLWRLVWVNDSALGGSYIVNCDIHALDVALWIARDVPVSATGHSCRIRPGAHLDSHDCYGVTFQLKDGAVLTDHSEHVGNKTGFRSGCCAYGEKGHVETNYGGKVFIQANDGDYAGGECPDLYAEGMMRNVDAFHRSIVQGDCSNPTLEPSINVNLATILGREAALTGRKITWDEILKDKKRLEPDLTGLTE